MINGMPTAHAYPFMRKHFKSDLMYVWPDLHGKARGLAIEPFIPNNQKQPKKMKSYTNYSHFVLGASV
jgi:hypothetical protein